MKKSLLIVASVVLSLFASAQTSHSVTVGSGMTYTPNQLTIVSGDNVTFTSGGGTHDVNFSTNSITGVSFDNPADIEYLPIQGAGLMGTITFDVPGTYNYDCSVYGHASMGMVGQVVVNASASNTVVDVIVGSPDHTTLEAAVIAAGLAETLSGDGPFTVFAPTDAAFALLAEGTLEYLLANTGALTSILTHHVYGGIALSTDLSDGMMVTTLAGTSLTVSITDEGVYIDNAMVTVANIEADNGVVHVIDAVLIPAEEETNTVVDVIVGSPDHTTLAAAVVAAGLVETLSGDGPFTVFAPTDAAFALLPEGTVEDLLADPTGALTSILTHHVYGGTALSTDLSDGMMVTTLAGTSLTVSITDEGVFIDNAMVTVANIETDNGVVHVIDAVLLPANLSIDEFLNVENGQYLYSIDVLGKRIKRTTLNRIIFDIYSSGNVVKRFSNK